MTEDDLEFVQIRSGTDQWSVRFEGEEICIITARVVATPAYSIRMNGKETFHDDRDAVIEVLLKENRDE